MDHIETINQALEGRYRIEREIGAGGMATVYVARDERHDRQVALKVLKPELAAVVGAERFLAEIRTTANLQHPHILQLYDSGEADGLLFFVMPYVEGETLRDRIDREKQLPVDEAVGLARAIAAALHAAHERGVIHRDIKPANILLSHGEPLIADFGIALAVQEAGGGRLTETGLSVGTPFYMSPEQATGDRHPDARSDIYSLGTLLYEMLTGEPPFQGATAQAVLGKILTGTPAPPTEYRKSIPPHVEAVVLRSLERLPADRFSSAAEFGEALGNPAFRHRTGAHAPVGEGSTSPEDLGRLRRNVRALAAAVVVTGAALIWSLLGGGTAPMGGAPLVEFLVLGDSTHGITSGTPSSVALDPEGGMIGYVGVRNDGGRQIFVRALDDRTPRPIPGTEDAHDVFFSPDGAWIGFTTASQNDLYKIRLAGGSRIHLATLPGSMAGAAWGDDDAIYYGVTGPPGLMRVPAAGGEPIEILQQSTTLLGVIDPHIPPRPDLVLFTGLASDRGATVQAFRPSTGEVRVLAPGMTPKYVQGRLVYATSTGVVLAEPFDLSRLEFTGEPAQVATGVGGWIDLSRDMTASRSGTIAYVEGGAGNSNLMVSEGPVGTELRSGGNMYAPRASPDGDRILHAEASGSTFELYIYSRSQRTNRLIHTAPYMVGADWSPDGETVIVASGADLLDFDLFLVVADGGAAPRLFRDLPPDQGTTVPEFSPDGTWVVWNGAREGEGLQTNAILIAPVDGQEDDVRRIVDDGSWNSQPTIAPDGRWMAYTSDRTGRPEVYVTPFPDGGVGVPISIAGGLSPVWSPEGALIYFDGAELILAELALGESVQVLSRSGVRNWTYSETNRNPRRYDALADTAMVYVAASSGGNRIVVRTALLPSN